MSKCGLHLEQKVVMFYLNCQGVHLTDCLVPEKILSVEKLSIFSPVLLIIPLCQRSVTIDHCLHAKTLGSLLCILRPCYGTHEG